MPKQSPDFAEEGHVQALYEFGYDAKLPRVERGQVFKLGGHENDPRLLTLRYVVAVKPGTPVKQCGSCGKLFIDDETRTVHGDTWHAFTCECGWVAPAGTKTSRAKALSEHRERCDTMKEARAAQRSAHLQEVKEIKAPVAVAVG